MLLGAACAALVSGCGGAAKPQGPPAPRVCGQAAKAAARVIGHAPSEKIVSPDRVDIVCRLRSGRLTIRVEAQASTQPWVEYGTTQVHLVQAFGSGSVHKRSQLPRNVTGVGSQAIWVPAQEELVTTNATSESSAGSYLTVDVNHGGRSAQRLATQVARAALAMAPSGPKPGAAPS
jgi:hypothetical protein